VIVTTSELSQFSYLYIMIAHPSTSRVNSVRELYCCWFFLLVNAPNCRLSLVFASVIQSDAVNSRYAIKIPTEEQSARNLATCFCSVVAGLANFEKFGHFFSALAMKNAFGHFVKFCHLFGHLVIVKLSFITYFGLLYFLDDIHVTHCYRNTVAIQRFFALKFVAMI